MNQAQTLPGIGDLVDGRFRIDRMLGEGGTSTVYEVSHVITDKKFAIKWLLPELALEDAAVDRFIHEARVGGKFDHPLAVEVYDICKANDSFYMLMELLQGESLQSRLERVGRLSVHDACSIVLTCADVLSAAHRVGIIHRDLKPANIFLCKDSDGQELPKLLDFGISTFYSDLQSISLTATPRGSVIGTPLYMSPEQMLSQAIDPRTDIYALGAVLYELVSGQPPYQADSYAQLVVKVTVEARPTPLDQIAPVDRQFVALVAKAMARKPGDRFATVDELAAALRSYVGAIESSSIRAISAAAKPQLLESQSGLLLESQSSESHPRRRATAAVGRLSRVAVWAGLVALGGAAAAAAGARYLDRSSVPLSGESQTAELTSTPVPSTELVQAQAPGATWNHPVAGPDMLTGRAAPEEPPEHAKSNHARGRASVGLEASPRRGAGSASLAVKLAAKQRSEGSGHRHGRQTSEPSAADSDSDSESNSMPSSRASRTGQPDGAGAARLVRTRSDSDEAAVEVEVEVEVDPAAKVRIRRSDFAAPPEPAGAMPPRAAVSRDDF